MMTLYLTKPVFIHSLHFLTNVLQQMMQDSKVYHKGLLINEKFEFYPVYPVFLFAIYPVNKFALLST